MNCSVVVYSILICIICILLALVQYYYIIYKRISLRVSTPYFRELIPSHTSIAYDVGFKDAVYLLIDDRNTAQTEKVHTPTVTEIEYCLKAALAYKSTGKLEKALRLFEHAAAMAPNNADVLNKYGEFLEVYEEDVVKADQLYFKALSYSPDHSGALSNRKRTANVVDQMDLVMFVVIDDKRDKLRERMDLSFDVKKKAFYLHIYHSVGIEGNTLSVSQLEYLLETGRVVNGKSIVEHNEILGLEIALKYVKILANAEKIETEHILEIHRRVMGHADPLAAGSFRAQQVFVSSHIPPPPEQIPDLMEKYIEWLNSEEAYEMHPVRFAALAHYKLVDIHPFMDGNGRTSRLIMNLILLRSGYPPVIIHKEDRQQYYEHLKIANDGDVRPFVRFIAYCTDETLNTYLGYNSKIAQITDTKKRTPVIELDGIKQVDF